MNLKTLSSIVCFALAAATPFAASAQNAWVFKQVNANGLSSASLQQQATVLNRPSTVRLAFSLTKDDPTKTSLGAVGIEFSVGPITPLNAFDFDALEGPSGRTSKLTVEVHANGRPTAVFTLPATGWRPVDMPDGFTFSHSHLETRRKAALRDVLQRLAKGASRVDVSVTDRSNKAAVLKASFAVDGQQDAFKALLAAHDRFQR